MTTPTVIAFAWPWGALPYDDATALGQHVLATRLMPAGRWVHADQPIRVGIHHDEDDQW